MFLIYQAKQGAFHHALKSSQQTLWLFIYLASLSWVSYHGPFGQVSKPSRSLLLTPAVAMASVLGLILFGLQSSAAWP